MLPGKFVPPRLSAIFRAFINTVFRGIKNSRQSKRHQNISHTIKSPAQTRTHTLFSKKNEEEEAARVITSHTTGSFCIGRSSSSNGITPRGKVVAVQAARIRLPVVFSSSSPTEKRQSTVKEWRSSVVVARQADNTKVRATPPSGRRERVSVSVGTPLNLWGKKRKLGKIAGKNTRKSDVGESKRTARARARVFWVCEGKKRNWKKRESTSCQVRGKES